MSVNSFKIEDKTGTTVTLYETDDPPEASDIQELINKVSGDQATEQTLSDLANALSSRGADQLQVKFDQIPQVEISDQNANLAQQVTLQAIASAVDSQGSDNMRVVLTQDMVGLATEQTLSALAGALASNGGDTLQVEQQSPVRLEDTNGQELDPPTESTLASLESKVATESTLQALAEALQSNGSDTLQVDLQSSVQIENESGNAISPGDSGAAFANGDSISGGTQNTYRVDALGGSSIYGEVMSTGQYDVDIRWLGGNGSVIRTQEIDSLVSGGEWTEINLNPKSPHAELVVTDRSSTSKKVSLVLHYS